MAKKNSKIENKTQPSLCLQTWLQQNLRISTNHKYRIYMDVFLQPDVLKTWRFVNLTFCKPDILQTRRFETGRFETWRFVGVPQKHLDIEYCHKLFGFHFYYLIVLCCSFRFLFWIWLGRSLPLSKTRSLPTVDSSQRRWASHIPISSMNSANFCD